ncbi:hypothetical protein A6779_11500 [Marinobacter adhaerens]|uniref:Uncharacterized protein n=1 Tax=Marinobacter salsuginis TaxID=418719 RepID=A0A5M3PKV5_9GAMM|nr:MULTISPECIES: hypothetical protein [Marinobacter]ODM29755.1 hypothetical protein A6779_11500 [Marinobacter adhaerens]GBO83458.1 hypothetical protein MS5N3_09090 [Marinobacter salsuginis]
MAEKKIQEQFGQVFIDAMAEFAKKDIKTTSELENDEFTHVQDQNIRTALAETLYGARWLYKLGLALLATDEEQYAHVRAQIIDYASICEALLADVICQAYQANSLQGTQYQYFDIRQNNAMRWNRRRPLNSINNTTFEWRIKVAEESGIIDSQLTRSLNGMRDKRNTVHLTRKITSGVTYWAGFAKRSHTTMYELINQTKSWAGV